MRTNRPSLRTAAALGALALGLGLAGCATPSGPNVEPGGPAAACPVGFADEVNAAAQDQGIEVTFAQGSLSDFRPEELRTLISSACVLTFEGSLEGGRAKGAFAFVTATLDGAAFESAVVGLGYEGSGNSWLRTPNGSTTQADVITRTTPSGSGSLLDLSDVFPEVTTVVSSFQMTAS